MTDDKACRDRGSTSLTVVLLAPLLLVLMFAGFQAAMWNHARTEARVVARETAVLVARDHLAAGAAAQVARTSLAKDSVLSGPEVLVSSTDTAVVITITGRAPGLLRGTSSAVRVTAAVSREGWVPL
ncbi:MAG TPA: TadE/TadG family type IV pilus assembly protein [Ilumatobacteraceae bacterium]|nr:TadE/TadG family type IV pilus assembly protein [Ilumatobacteraceae bacterium]